jgi:hypothetical protein
VAVGNAHAPLAAGAQVQQLGWIENTRNVASHLGRACMQLSHYIVACAKARPTKGGRLRL